MRLGLAIALALAVSSGSAQAAACLATAADIADRTELTVASHVLGSTVFTHPDLTATYYCRASEPSLQAFHLEQAQRHEPVPVLLRTMATAGDRMLRDVTYDQFDAALRDCFGEAENRGRAERTIGGASLACDVRAGEEGMAVAFTLQAWR